MKAYIQFFTAIILCLLSAGLLHAQQPDPKNPENENLAVPANWNVILDQPDAAVTIGADSDSADIYFVNMVPGWHITTGPRAIFWHPNSTAKDSYKASTKIHLFNPKGRNEAFGIFIGGRNLDQPDQAYTYFLLRNSGEYLIKNRTGSETSIVQAWTAAPSMATYTEDTESSVANVLRIEVDQEQVHFFVNDQQAHSLPKEDLYTDGIVGLRINHALNVHVEDFEVVNQ